VRHARADWSFAHLGMKQTQESVHFFHHWTAKFIPQIPRQAIELYAEPGDVVLDPFMGCGTTLVEAARRGHDSWGTDINPLAVKIAQAKTAPVDADALTEFIAWLEVAAARPERHWAESAALFEGHQGHPDPRPAPRRQHQQLRAGGPVGPAQGDEQCPHGSDAAGPAQDSEL
jgi:hypothetical protein